MASFSRKRQLETDHGQQEEEEVAGGRRHSMQPSKLARQPQPASRAESLFDSLFHAGQQEQQQPQQEEEEGVGEQEVGQEVAEVQQQVESRQPRSGTQQAQAEGGAEGDADLAAAVQRRLEQHKTRMMALAAAQSHRRRGIQPLGF